MRAARARRARDAHLHLGHHRAAQGRDALAPEPRVDRDDRRRACAAAAPTRRGALVPAALAHRRADVHHPRPHHRRLRASTSPSRWRRSPTTSRRCSPPSSSACPASGRSSTPASPASSAEAAARAKASIAASAMRRRARAYSAARRRRASTPPPLLARSTRLADRLLFSQGEARHRPRPRAHLRERRRAHRAKEVLEFFAGPRSGRARGLRPVRGHRPHVSINRPGKQPLGTVGPPFPGVEVRIADGRRDPGARPQRLPRLLQGARGDRRGARRRLAPLGRPRRLRRARLPARSPAARRRSSSPPAARTSRPRTSRAP